MCDAGTYRSNSFECECRAVNCRGAYTSNDWAIPAMWSKYDGYFSPHLKLKIEKFRKECPESPEHP
jgi:hypothetical protein